PTRPDSTRPYGRETTASVYEILELVLRRTEKEYVPAASRFVTVNGLAPVFVARTRPLGSATVSVARAPRLNVSVALTLPAATTRLYVREAGDVPTDPRRLHEVAFVGAIAVKLFGASIRPGSDCNGSVDWVMARMTSARPAVGWAETVSAASPATTGGAADVPQKLT